MITIQVNGNELSFFINGVDNGVAFRDKNLKGSELFAFVLFNNKTDRV